jgi:hypothetical protein
MVRIDHFGVATASRPEGSDHRGGERQPLPAGMHGTLVVRAPRSQPGAARWRRALPPVEDRPEGNGRPTTRSMPEPDEGSWLDTWWPLRHSQERTTSYGSLCARNRLLPVCWFGTLAQSVNETEEIMKRCTRCVSPLAGRRYRVA